MTTFTAWKFETVDGAEKAVAALKGAQGDGLVKIVDHAVISWPEGAEQPKMGGKHGSAKRGAGWGALWGILGGALFAVPVAGAVVGAGIGALAKATEGTGITKQDMERIRTEITPGTSALFLVTDNALIPYEPFTEVQVDAPSTFQFLFNGAFAERDDF